MNPAQMPFAVAAGIMFLTGIGIPVMAALNSGLGRALVSPAAATVLLCGLALILALAALAVVSLAGAAPVWSGLRSAPPASYGAAVFYIFYVLSVTTLAPRIGIGNAIFFVLLGQLVAAAAIDHYGLLGSLRFPLTARRLLGIGVIAVGVWLAKRAR